jgi:dolichol-phosphate mannosyltransferase
VRIAVMTPTYNERDNVDEFLARVRAAVPTADVYFVDDNSPDGTGQLVTERVTRDGRIHLVARTGERGYAAASREGLATIAASDYDAIVTIDCDLSHDPNVIPTMLDRLALGADVVIGSRYVTGGGVRNWSLVRRLLSRWGNLYTSFMLGVDVRDCTSGFRVYGRRVISSGVIPSTTSNGYAFLSEVLMRLRIHRNYRMTEVPIIYVERVRGESKMNRTIISESMRLVTKWGFQRFLRRN